MNRAAVTPRAQALLRRIEAWAHRGPVRAVVVKVGVSVLGPLIVLAGVAMTVLPGPGLVVIALGMALLALEYEWARHLMGGLGRILTRARRAALPSDASLGRRAAGVVTAGGFVVATTALTAAVTAFVGTSVI
jgi:uncharacterized protein (TIGR02611 family)